MNADIHTRIDQIKGIFPDEVRAVQLHDSGEDFFVIEVNHEWMFRFPRSPYAEKALQAEKLFLPEFEKIAPIAVPRIRYVGDGFIAYRKITGSLLTPQLFDTLSPGTRERMAGQMGKFLSTLHTFPLEEAFKMGLTEGWDGWRRRSYQSFKASIAPLLSPQTRQNALAFLDRFFTLDWKRVVIHGDFYPPDHLFFDEQQEELCGVIDFGDLTIEDAATDFQSVLEDFGEEFFLDVVEHYSGEIDADFIDRIKVRLRAWPLFDAAYALEYGFEERFRRLLPEIETAFGKEYFA
jgi:aminoglycoside 2''-phosphotransferase